MIKRFIDNINPNRKFLFITITIFFLFFFFNYLNIQLTHILALGFSLLIIIYITETDEIVIGNVNNELEYKLANLYKDKNITSFFYLEPDFINLFYNIKNDLQNFNPDSYYNALLCTNNLLSNRFDVEISISKGKFIMENISDIYDDSEEQIKKAMNYLHSFIYTMPIDEDYHKKLDNLLTRARIIYKRELYIIKKIVDFYNEKNLSYKTKFNTNDFDIQKPYNKSFTNPFSNKNNYSIADNNFNFYT